MAVSVSPLVKGEGCYIRNCDTLIGALPDALKIKSVSNNILHQATRVSNFNEELRDKNKKLRSEALLFQELVEYLGETPQNRANYSPEKRAELLAFYIKTTQI